MVQAGRVACIFTPFALSIATLVCFILVFLGGTSEHNNTLGSFYFFKADLSNFANATQNDLLSIINTRDTTAAVSARDTSVNSELNTLLVDAQKALKIQDYYTVYLWNYCSWNGNDKYSFCSPRKSEFWFNPVEVWGLNGTGAENLFPKELKDGLDTYKNVSKYMFIVYVIALVATIVELLIGVSAMFSRWGSFVTTFFAVIAFIFTFAASLISTILFAALKTDFNHVFKAYNIKGSLGLPMLRTTWLAVLFSGAAAFFWFISICCCSGRSPYKGRNRDQKRVKVEKTPYTYERVGSPYLGPQGNGGYNVPLTNVGPSRQSAHIGPAGREAAYEPFRPQ